MPFFGVPIRNGLPIGLGSVAGFGVQQFDPSQLFAGGTVAGAWYDPSDLTTLFTTSAGTTPVAMPGLGSAVSVGLMLDKSQGLVLGPELVTNGDFSSGTTGWTAEPGVGVTLSAAGGVLTITQVGGTLYGRAYQALNGLTVGQFYQYTASVVSNPSSRAAQIWAHSSFTGTPAAGQYSATITGTGNLVVRFQATATTMYVVMWLNTTQNGSLGFSNASVKALPGNHAISFNDTTARPELRARVNLITNSENFAGSGWSGTANVATDVTTAPNGTTTADSITAATTATFRYLRRSPSELLANVQFIWSVSAKKNTADWVTLRFWDTNPGTAAWFNLATGTIGTVQAGCTASISDQGNGWYRCSITRTIGATVAFNETDFQVSSGDNTNNANAGDSVFLWGADLRPANIGANVPAYQRIADANTYDTSGFPLYLRFDGIDDSMYTPANLNLSGTDKVTVFAGVRKLSDAAFGMVAETSPIVDANNGAMALGASIGGAQRWVSALRGTSLAYYEPATYAAPVTNVLATLSDIAGAGISNEIVPRINGVVEQDNPVGASAGTGNFGTYPLFIGARNNANTWLNGQIYSLIIAGSAVSAGNISATEQWVAGKTGIQI